MQVIVLTCLFVAVPSGLAAFSAFHASPVFAKTRDKETAPSALPFFPPTQQQKGKPVYQTGFIPIRSLSAPPPAAPLTWEHLPLTDTLHRLPINSFDAQNQKPPAPNVKPAKGGTVYPKKWIPTSPEGKKIQQKNVEKHRKQLVVASSMTTKDLRDAEEEEGGALQPSNERKATRYEPRTVEPVSSHSEIPIEAVASPESRREVKPYAHNHKQEASGTGFAPLFAAEPSSPHHAASAGFVGHGGVHQIGDGSGDRVHFHVHGEKGPESYRFGYDTGKGPDRHFRYEERDDHGNVKGHYGFYDKHGKLQAVHYSADPKNGFSADGGNFGKHGIL